MAEKFRLLRGEDAPAWEMRSSGESGARSLFKSLFIYLETPRMHNEGAPFRNLRRIPSDSDNHSIKDVRAVNRRLATALRNETNRRDSRISLSLSVCLSLSLSLSGARVTIIRASCRNGKQRQVRAALRRAR